MKIEGLSRKTTAIGPQEPSQNVQAAAGSPFVQELEKVATVHHRERLDQLLRDIASQGELLADSRSLGVLKKYKDLVKNFMEEALSGSYKVKEDRSWDHRGRHKSMTVIERIDRELEELTQIVLAGEKDHLVLLAKMDEIRGLLCDLYT